MLCSALPVRAAPVDPSGVWLVEDGTARIRIEHCRPSDDHVCGYIVWTKDDGSPGLDAQNPDPAKQTRPLLGIQLILGFSADDDHYAGKLYNAENGKLYDTQVKLEDDTHLSMKGCVLRYLCGSQTWTKVDDVATGQLTAATDAPGGPRADAEWAQDKASAGHKHTKKKAAL